MRVKRSRLSEKKIKPNQYIELVVFDPDQGKLNLFSKVLEVDAEKLVIAWPHDAHKCSYYFKKVDYAIVQCLVGGEAISFKVRIKPEDLESHEGGKLALGLPLFVEEMDQKRIFTRIKYQIPVKFKVDNGAGFSESLFEGLSTDLSIGGMELASFENLVQGIEIECFFTLHYVDFKGVQAKIVRRKETTENGNLEFIYALKFTGMLERERIALNQILMSHHPIAQPKILINRSAS